MSPSVLRTVRPLVSASLVALALAAGAGWAQAPTAAPGAAAPTGAAAAPSLSPPSAPAVPVPPTIPNPPTPPATPIAPQFDPRPGLRTGGAPTSAEAFRTLAAEGFRTFVDLRGDAEIPPETAALAAASGVAYERIPVTGDADVDLGTARRLKTLLGDPARQPMVLACHSGNRAGALLAVEAFWLEGKGAEEALAVGKAGGLTRLEPSVRQLLGLPPLPPPAAVPAPTRAPTTPPAPVPPHG